MRHHDHVLARFAGGATTAQNAQGLCQQCNHAKQAPGWAARPGTGPPGSLHRTRTSTPTGQRLVSTAPELPRPSPLAPRPTRAELAFHELLLTG